MNAPYGVPLFDSSQRSLHNKVLLLDVRPPQFDWVRVRREQADGTYPFRVSLDDNLFGDDLDLDRPGVAEQVELFRALKEGRVPERIAAIDDRAQRLAELQDYLPYMASVCDPTEWRVKRSLADLEAGVFPSSISTLSGSTQRQAIDELRATWETGLRRGAYRDSQVLEECVRICNQRAGLYDRDAPCEPSEVEYVPMRAFMPGTLSLYAEHLWTRVKGGDYPVLVVVTGCDDMVGDIEDLPFMQLLYKICRHLHHQSCDIYGVCFGGQALKRLFTGRLPQPLVLPGEARYEYHQRDGSFTKIPWEQSGMPRGMVGVFKMLCGKGLLHHPALHGVSKNCFTPFFHWEGFEVRLGPSGYEFVNPPCGNVELYATHGRFLTLHPKLGGGPLIQQRFASVMGFPRTSRNNRRSRPARTIASQGHHEFLPPRFRALFSPKVRKKLADEGQDPDRILRDVDYYNQYHYQDSFGLAPKKDRRGRSVYTAGASILWNVNVNAFERHLRRQKKRMSSRRQKRFSVDAVMNRVRKRTA